jgi:3-oxoacyl-[acyl-carrier protein] reductase
MDLGIKGKRALIGGSSKGMGKAIALMLAAEGADVFLVSRNDSELSTAAKDVAEKAKGKVDYSAGDLSSKAGRENLIKTVKEDFGDIDILVHNVGGPQPSLAVDTSLESWQQGFEQLFASVVHLNQAFIPAMKQKRWGRILTVTSLSVMEPIANLAVSNGMRTAVTAMLKTLADELAPFNITVNCVAPGAIATGRMEDLLSVRAERSKKTIEEYTKEYLQNIPAGRMGSVEEFAAVTCFLASELASYVTGSTVCVDGGKRRATV